MARRSERVFSPTLRNKIETTKLLNRLQNNALADKSMMDQGQIACARILLDKALPNLAQTTISGDEDNPVKHVVEVRHFIVRQEDGDTPGPDGSSI